MPRFSRLFPLLALLGGEGKLVAATFDQFFFNSEPNYSCPGSLACCCEAPSVCATDFTTAVNYCCNPPSAGATVDIDGAAAAAGQCWTSASTCGNSGSSSHGPTFLCESGADSWCCLSEREVCWTSDGQWIKDLCWSALPNPLTNLSIAALNATYTALARASPTAATLSVNLRAVPTDSAGLAAPAVTVTSTHAGATVTVTSPRNPNASPTSDTYPIWPAQTTADRVATWSSIVGVILAIIFAVLLVIGGIWLCVRRKRRLNRMRRQAAMYGPVAAAGGFPLGPTTGAAAGPAGVPATTDATRGTDATAAAGADDAGQGDMLLEARAAAMEARAKAFAPEYYAPTTTTVVEVPAAEREGAATAAGKDAGARTTTTTTATATTMTGRFA